MKKKILNHFLKEDPVLYRIIEKVGLVELTPSASYFNNLCRSIVGQQLSIKVAQVIFERLKNLALSKELTPEFLLNATDQKLREVGLSKSKVAYLKDLAMKVHEKEINLNSLKDLKDEEIVLKLTQVKGIGIWTAEMFLMFSLAREDVFSHGDLGLKNAIKKIYKLETITKKEVEKIVRRWSPYRTYASKVLWMSLTLKTD